LLASFFSTLASFAGFASSASRHGLALPRSRPEELAKLARVEKNLASYVTTDQGHHEPGLRSLMSWILRSRLEAQAGIGA